VLGFCFFLFCLLVGLAFYSLPLYYLPKVAVKIIRWTKSPHHHHHIFS
jgi:hypothetical protein